MANLYEVIMFESDIFEPDEEYKGLFYLGFEIVTYTGKDNQESLKQKVKQYFSGDGWTFISYEHRFFVNYEPYNSEVEVFFNNVIPQSDFTKNAKKYKIMFKSPYMGMRKKDEKIHKKLCYLLLSRLHWKKMAFWLKDGKRFPIPIKQRLKLKRK